MNNAQDIMDQVKSILDADAILYERLVDGPAIRCGYMGVNGSFPIIDLALTQEQFRLVLGAAIQRSLERYHVFGRLLFDNDLTPAAAVAEFEFARRDDGQARQ